MHTNYPVAEDLQAAITSLGIIKADKLDAAVERMNLDAKTESAWRWWETRTRYIPFFNDSTVSTRYFDPPGPNTFGYVRGGGRLLPLDGGLVSVTTLHIAAQQDNIAPTLLTENSDYFLSPYNAAAKGRPFERIEFLIKQWGWPRSIAIRGVWGFCTSLPDDVWQAILQRGLVLCFQELTLAISKGLFSYRSLSTEVRYASSRTVPLEAEMKEWERKSEEMATFYRRVI